MLHRRGNPGPRRRARPRQEHDSRVEFARNCGCDIKAARLQRLEIGKVFLNDGDARGIEHVQIGRGIGPDQ